MEPRSYKAGNYFQRIQAQRVIDTYGKYMKFNEDGTDTVLDIGCGIGDVTKDILLPSFGPFAKLVAVDLSDEMVEYAKKLFNDPRITVRQLDIATDHLPEDLTQQFNLIYSFYCFNWVKDQTRMFETVASLLKPGGQMLCSCFIKSVAIDAMAQLEKNPKWKEYYVGIGENIFVYNFMSDPLEAIKQSMSDAGLEVQHSVYQDNIFDFKDAKQMMDNLNPVNIPHKLVPDWLKEEHSADLLELIEAQNVRDPTNTVMYQVPFNTATFYVTKPELPKQNPNVDVENRELRIESVQRM